MKFWKRILLSSHWYNLCKSLLGKVTHTKGIQFSFGFHTVWLKSTLFSLLISWRRYETDGGGREGVNGWVWFYLYWFNTCWTNLDYILFTLTRIISDLYTDDSKDRNKVAVAVINIKWHTLSTVSRCGNYIFTPKAKAIEL